jgi:TRAP-type C4-dicarboxylate transport system permease small subunit
MLFIAFLAAVCLYVVLGYLWLAAQPHFNAATPVLETVRHLILDLPQATPLALLKLGLLLMAFYLIADSLFSYSAKRRRSAHKRPSAKEVLAQQRNAAPPAQDP